MAKTWIGVTFFTPQKAISNYLLSIINGLSKKNLCQKLLVGFFLAGLKEKITFASKEKKKFYW